MKPMWPGRLLLTARRAALGERVELEPRAVDLAAAQEAQAAASGREAFEGGVDILDVAASSERAPALRFQQGAELVGVQGAHSGRVSAVRLRGGVAPRGKQYRSQPYKCLRRPCVAAAGGAA